MKRKFKYNICFWVFFGVLSSGKAQEKVENLSFTSLQNNITKAAVSAIAEDDKGYIWIGTDGSGLYRFDGIKYHYYRHNVKDPSSLSSSLIFCTFVDSREQLWVGTENGLNLYNSETDSFRRIKVNESGQNDDFGTSVISLAESSEGDIIIGTFEKGYYKLELPEFRLVHLPTTTNPNENLLNVNTILVDTSGEIFAGSSFGLEKFNVISNTFESAMFNTKDGFVNFDKSIQSMLFAESGCLWIGTVDNGVYSVCRNSDEYIINHHDITDKRILSIIELRNGSLVIGTENDGLFHLTTNGHILKNYTSDKNDKRSIGSNSIWSLFLDSQNRIWMGYYNNGIAIYDSYYDKFDSFESLANNNNSLLVGSVTGIIEKEKGRFWFSLDGGGIDQYTQNNDEFKHLYLGEAGYVGLNAADIQTIFKDSKGNIWAGSWNNGIFWLPNGSKRFINYNKDNLPGIIKSNRIMSFDEDSEGVIWIGTFYDGLLSYNPINKLFTKHDSKPFTQYGLQNSAVRKVLVDQADKIWMGTTKGLFNISKEEGKTFRVESMVSKVNATEQNSTSGNHILALHEGSDGRIWIGTRGSGISYYDSVEDSYVFCNEKMGLTQEIVSSILEDDSGNLWISGNAGLSKLDIESSRSTTFVLADGLLSYNFNFNSAYKDSKGKLYLGNDKGVDFFNPNKLALNQKVPKLYFTGFKLFNKDSEPNQKGSPLKKSISETKSIELTHEQSVFTIEYTGINFTRPEKNQYAYFLEGLEDSWNYVGDQQSATYTNLDNGEYTFKLKAANNDGIWNDEHIELQIVVLPPWWKTNIALCCYFAIFLGAIYLLNNVTKTRLKQRQLIKNERDRRIREKKLHEEKLQFFTNISHEFRTPLTLILNPLKDIIKDAKLELPQSVKDKHQIIFKNTDRLHRLIGELMDFRKLEHNKVNIKAREFDIVELSNQVFEYFINEAEAKKIHLGLETDEPILKIWADESMIEKVIFNIVSNAMKVTQEGGVIMLNILSNDLTEEFPLIKENEVFEGIEILVSDTGPGLTEEEVSKIFKRFYQVKNLNKTYYGGTGIGLEVVQNFVTLHKGKVEVSSKLGQGTTFRVVLPKGKNHFSANELFIEEREYILPITQPQVMPTENMNAVSVDLEETKAETKLRTLLIVEDNAELRNYLAQELKIQYRIIEAKDGKEGYKVAKEVLPDIILTDVIMPEMDGFTFCRIIKEDIRTSHIPLLMLTAKAKIDDRIEGIGMGADAYMVKPFDMRLLKLRLEQLVVSRQIIFDKYFSKISSAEDNKNATSLDKDFMQRVLDYIYENLSDTNLSVENLAAQLHLSRSQLYRKIKSLTGLTVNQFYRKIRLQKAKQIIEQENQTNISEVCYRVGFSSPSYFTKCFKAHFGILPTEVEKTE